MDTALQIAAVVVPALAGAVFPFAIKYLKDVVESTKTDLDNTAYNAAYKAFQDAGKASTSDNG